MLNKFDATKVIRLSLFLTFFGHSLVSFGLSPSYSLHFKLVESINFLDLDTKSILYIHAFFDLVIAILLLTLKSYKNLIKFIILYLLFVASISLVFYWQQTSEIFGLAECLRRFPWIMFCVFLLTKKLHFIRVGVSLAFLSHGLASLEILGMNQGHIEIANQFLSIGNAKLFVKITGFSDLLIGAFLLLSIYAKQISFIASIWIAIIVLASLFYAIPDAIFRSGFLIPCIYVFMNKETHLPKLVKL